MTKREHEKKVTLLRKLEMKRAEYLKTAKTRKDVETLESRLMVATQAIESTSLEIVKLRETELYPQLIELVKRSVMYQRFNVDLQFLLPMFHHRFNSFFADQCRCGEACTSVIRFRHTS